jgi:hypothetical protein
VAVEQLTDDRQTLQSPRLTPTSPHPLFASSVPTPSNATRRIVDDPTAQQAPFVQAERRVGVQLHPVSPLGLVASDTPASKEARMNQPPRNYI